MDSLEYHSSVLDASFVSFTQSRPATSEGGQKIKGILLATIPATIPTLAVFVGILLNQSGLIRLENRLDARITGLGGRLDARMNTLSNEIVALRKQLHDDIVMLVGRETDKSERLARLGERSKG